jgi:hypothetical protein
MDPMICFSHVLRVKPVGAREDKSGVVKRFDQQTGSEIVFLNLCSFIDLSFRASSQLSASPEPRDPGIIHLAPTAVDSNAIQWRAQMSWKS